MLFILILFLWESPGKSRSISLVLFLAIALDLFAVGLIIPLYTTTYVRLDISATTFGLIGSVYGFAQFAFNPIIGRLSDTYGRKRMLLISFVGCAVSYIILGFARTVALLLLSRVIVGVLKQTTTIANAWIADATVEGEERVASLARMNTATYIGFLAGPALGGWLLRTMGNEAPAIASSAIFVLNFVLVTFLLSDDSNAKHEAISQGKQIGSAWSSFFKVFNRPQTVLLLVARFSLYFAGQLDHSQYSLYMVKHFSSTAEVAAYVMSYSGFICAISTLKSFPRPFRVMTELLTAAVISAFLLRPITSRFSMRLLLNLGLSVQATMYLLRMYLDLTGLLATWPIFTLASVLHSTLLLSSYTATFSSEDLGIALGIEGSVHSLARVFGPTCGGLVMDAYGYEGLSLSCSALGFLGLAISLLLNTDEKRAIREVPKKD